jgi:hypothetical protein
MAGNRCRRHHGTALAVLLLLKEETHLRDGGRHENRFAVAYWMTLEGETPWWQTLAGSNAVADFDGSIVGYVDGDIDGWFPLPER